MTGPLQRRRPRARLRLLLALALVVVGLAGCGGAEPEPDARRVDPALAPPTIPPDLALHESTDPATAEALANPGDHTVVADARIWEIRRVDKLVGTLQITTLHPDVDLTVSRNRLQLVRQILATEPVSIRIGDAEVYQTIAGDRATYVWFGAGMLEILQVRDRGVEDFEPYPAAVIAHQQTQPSWVPLPDLIGVEDA